MIFSTSQRRTASHIVNTRCRHEHLRSTTRKLSSAPTPTRAAQAFYCDVLGARQVWDEERPHNLSFILEGTRIDVNTSSPFQSTQVRLSVADPQELVERCWDAGYTVLVGQETAESAAVSVIDPFGRRIELVR
jgi:catechol 2,3-dioxygenase-like lactoylglutathione lyase family enzyme